MRKVIFILLFILTHTLSQAIVFQTNSFVVRGKVTDLERLPLTGAGITVENTFLGVYTDKDGNYMLPALRSGVYKIRFSFVGYETESQEINLKSDTILNITLLSKSFMTEDVFVNA